MTTTGYAKYSTFLEKNNFQVVVIEEAAEVLESYVLSLLSKNNNNDWRSFQLRSKSYCYELIKYNFDISLFERLINNKLEYILLKYQRRMKPNLLIL